MDFFIHMQKKKTSQNHFWIKSFTYYTLSVIFFDALFFNTTILKPLFNFLVNLLYLLWLFEGGLLRKIVIVLLSLLLSMFGEILFMSFNLLVAGKGYLVETPLSFAVSIICCQLLIFILYRACTMLLKGNSQSIRSSWKIYTLLIIYFSIIVYIYANTFNNLDYSPLYHQIQRIIFYGLLLISPFIIYKMTKLLLKMEKDISDEVMMQEMTQEYEKQLSTIYTSTDTERILRHDLMNYIETFKRVKDTDETIE